MKGQGFLSIFVLSHSIFKSFSSLSEEAEATAPSKDEVYQDKETYLPGCSPPSYNDVVENQSAAGTHNCSIEDTDSNVECRDLDECASKRHNCTDSVEDTSINTLGSSTSKCELTRLKLLILIIIPSNQTIAYI